jgi:hypothetical protein
MHVPCEADQRDPHVGQEERPICFRSARDERLTVWAPPASGRVDGLWRGQEENGLLGRVDGERLLGLAE